MQKRVAIMQPYFFPYIGYWQLIKAVECFVVYDNVKFTKKGWINRNRLLMNGEPVMFTLPLEKASDFLRVDQRRLGASFPDARESLLRRVEAAYRQAPYFHTGFQLFHDCLRFEETNLFLFIHHSILKVCDHLNISTPIVTASTIPIDHELRGEEKVIAMCKALDATDYYNPSGGRALYDAGHFNAAGLSLNFQDVKNISYAQLGPTFQPNLSILDVVMFNGRQEIKRLLDMVEWQNAGDSG
jgi:hypothetical protein